MANPLIPMSVQGTDLTTPTNLLFDSMRQGRMDQRRNQLLDLQQEGARLGNEQTRQQIDQEKFLFQLKDMASDAAPFVSALESDNPQLARSILVERIQRLESDPSRDASHSKKLLQQLDAGDIQGAKQSAMMPVMKLRQLQGGVDEAKVGRFREIRLPNGDIALFDSATSQVVQRFESEPIDLSGLPEDVQETVRNAPREVQEKVVQNYASPSGRKSRQESEEKEERAQQVKDNIKRLVGELLRNRSGVSAVSGVSAIGPTVRDKSLDAEAGLSELKDLLTVENLGIMSGVLTDRDLEVIKSVGAAGLAGSDERVISNLERMAEALGVEMPQESNSGAAPRMQQGNQPASQQGDVPQGVDPDLWQYMTDEEKALFRN